MEKASNLNNNLIYVYWVILQLWNEVTDRVDKGNINDYIYT